MKMIFLIYFFLEVVVTITLGGKIGGFNTFFEIIISAVIGAVIIMNFRKILMHSLSAVMSGQVSTQELFKGNLLSLLGAILLIVPGFLSDMIGVFLQLGFIKTLIASQFQKPQSQQEQTYTNKGDDNVIDVEIIEHTNTLK